MIYTTPFEESGLGNSKLLEILEDKEGETEVDYFCELARSLRVHVHLCKREIRESGFGTPQQTLKALKKISKAFRQIRSDLVTIFNVTFSLIEVACKLAS